MYLEGLAFATEERRGGGRIEAQGPNEREGSEKGPALRISRLSFSRTRRKAKRRTGCNGALTTETTECSARRASSHLISSRDLFSLWDPPSFLTSQLLTRTSARDLLVQPVSARLLSLHPPSLSPFLSPLLFPLHLLIRDVHTHSPTDFLPKFSPKGALLLAGGSVLSDLLDLEAGGEGLEELGGLLGVRDGEGVEVSGASDLEPVSERSKRGEGGEVRRGRGDVEGLG